MQGEGTAVHHRREHDSRAAADDRGYLEQVAGLSFGDVTEWTPERIVEVRDLLGLWNHNIRLADGVYTSNLDEFYLAHREVMEVINHALGGRFAGKRVADIVYAPHEEDYWWADVEKDGRVLLVAHKRRREFRSKVFE